MTEAAGPSNASSASATTGFNLSERVVSELRGLNRSASLTKWAAQLKAGVERFTTENRTPRAASEAQVVNTAFSLALELAEVMKKEAANRK